MNTDELIDRLRQAAAECSSWDNDMNPPYTDWSDLLDEAANEIERLREYWKQTKHEKPQ